MNTDRYQPRQLTILFDERCPFCVRSAARLAHEPAYIALELIPLRSEEASRRYQSLEKEIQEERFIVVDDHGAVYFDSDGLMVLYALKRFRSLALTLSHPLLKPISSAVLQGVSSQRYWLSRILGLTLPVDLDCGTCSTTCSPSAQCASEQCTPRGVL